MTEPKGSSVQLSTFLRWNTGDDLGFSVEKDAFGRDMVTRVWCKLCAQYLDKIVSDCRVHGVVRREIQVYITGTTSITKHNVLRHLSSMGHSVALEYRRNMEAELSYAGANELQEFKPEPLPDVTSEPPMVVIQPAPLPPVDHTTLIQAKEAYRRLLTTAYILAVDGQPFSAFPAMVKCQKANGVKLIVGTQNSKRAQEFVRILADVVQEKISFILTTVTTFSILCDSFPLKESGFEELVMVRTMHSGDSSCFVVGLQKLKCNEDIKASVDEIFRSPQKLAMPEVVYEKAMVSVVVDGEHAGVLERMKGEGREWLISIKYMCHHIRKACAVNITGKNKFQPCVDFLTSLSNILKKSPTLKKQFISMAVTNKARKCGIAMSKGPLCFDHLQESLNTLLYNWIVLIVAIEETLTQMTSQRLNGQLLQLLVKLKDLSFLAKCCLMKNTLDIVSKLFAVLSEGKVFVFQVGHEVKKCVSELQELVDGPTPTMQETCGIKELIEEGSKIISIHQTISKPGGSQASVDSSKLSFSGMTGIETLHSDTASLKARVIPHLIQLLEDSFLDFDAEIFQHMHWMDPANWFDSARDLNSLHILAEKFNIPLKRCGFHVNVLKAEWRNLLITVNSFYRGVEAQTLWKNIFLYRRREFPNICLLAEIIMSLGPSNHIMDNAFIALSSMITSQTYTRQKFMESCFLIRANNSIWSEFEREEILQAALNKVMSSHRKLTIDTSNFSSLEVIPAAKRVCLDLSVRPLGEESEVGDTGSDSDAWTESESEEEA